MESAVTAITFPYFFMERERYNHLDYFCMGIIEEISFILFVEDPAGNQKLCAGVMQKLKKNKVGGLQRKRG